VTLGCRRAARECSVFAFFLSLRVTSAAGDALVVTLHTVNTMTGLGKHKFIDTVATGATFEAVRVIRVVARHNSFIKDGLVTDAATV